jgi:hypothetical protein
VAWRRPRGSSEPVNDRSWSAHANPDPAAIGAGLSRRSALPAETGPMRAPDRLSVWPVEGGRYGIDAHYHGQTGRERAHWQQRHLAQAGLAASVRTDEQGVLLRLGPLAHGAVWVALEGFLGRPLPSVESDGAGVSSPD